MLFCTSPTLFDTVTIMNATSLRSPFGSIREVRLNKNPSHTVVFFFLPVMTNEATHGQLIWLAFTTYLHHPFTELICHFIFFYGCQNFLSRFKTQRTTFRKNLHLLNREFFLRLLSWLTAPATTRWWLQCACVAPIRP